MPVSPILKASKEFKSLRELNYFKDIIDNLKTIYKDIEESRLTYQMLRLSISKMINDIIKQSLKNIEINKINSINDIQNNSKFVISMSKKMKNDCNKINDFLFINVYQSSKLKEKRLKVEEITKKLFEYYSKNFNNLPNDRLIKEKYEDKNRIICDYISGMTDRYAFKLYKTIYD